MAGSAESKGCISNVADVKLGDRKACSSLAVHYQGLLRVFTHCTHRVQPTRAILFIGNNLCTVTSLTVLFICCWHFSRAQRPISDTSLFGPVQSPRHV